MRTMLIYADEPGRHRKILVHAHPDTVGRYKAEKDRWTATTALGKVAIESPLGEVTIESDKIVSYSPYI